MAAEYKVVPLPVPSSKSIATGITLLDPLSRKGDGPGLILLAPRIDNEDESEGLGIRNGVPSSLMKWAEEGYAVVELRTSAWTSTKDPLATAISALDECDRCTGKEAIGLISYEPALWKKVSSTLSSYSRVVGAVTYSSACNAGTMDCAIPLLQHLAGKTESKPIRTSALTQHAYPEAQSHLFATPFQSTFISSSESISHTRNLTFLKRLMNGPYFDLESIWDEHTYYEFASRNVSDTMSTMVQEPYVNHIPTITGGVGRSPLTEFYSDHFVHSNPADTELELISRTVGIDRVVDEFIFKFTHDRVINWILPGIPATGKYVQIPFTAIVNIRGDRLYHEHIAWDQTTALIQLGLMPQYLPFPYDIEGKEGKSMEYRVPGHGKETAEKMRDEGSVPSNRLFEGWVREVQANGHVK